MSRTGKVSRKFEFLDVFGTAEKSKGVTEKNKEKVKANCTGCSAKFFGSQSVEMFCFARIAQENKNSNVDKFLLETDISRAHISYIIATLVKFRDD